MKNTKNQVIYPWSNYYLISLLIIFLFITLALIFYSQTFIEVIMFIVFGITQFVLCMTFLRLKVVKRHEAYLTLGGWSIPVSHIVCAEINKYRVKIYYHEISGSVLKDKSFFIRDPRKFITDWNIKEAETLNETSRETPDKQN